MEEENLIFKATLLTIELEMQAMIAENTYRDRNGLSIAYNDESFMNLANKTESLTKDYAKFILDFRKQAVGSKNNV